MCSPSHRRRDGGLREEGRQPQHGGGRLRAAAACRAAPGPDDGGAKENGRIRHDRTARRTEASESTDRQPFTGSRNGPAIGAAVGGSQYGCRGHRGARWRRAAAHLAVFEGAARPRWASGRLCPGNIRRSMYYNFSVNGGTTRKAAAACRFLRVKLRFKYIRFSAAKPIGIFRARRRACHGDDTRPPHRKSSFGRSDWRGAREMEPDSLSRQAERCFRLAAVVSVFAGTVQHPSIT
jgi:hypothetical protein